LGLSLAGGTGAALTVTAGLDAALSDGAGMGRAAVFAGGRLGLIVATVALDALGVHFATEDATGVGVAAALDAALDLTASMRSAAILTGRRLGHLAVVFDAGRGDVAGTLGAGLALIAFFNALGGPIVGGAAAALDALVSVGALAVGALAVGALAVGALAVRALAVGALGVRALAAGVVAALVVFFKATLSTFAGGCSGALSTGSAVIALFNAGLERGDGAVSAAGDAGTGIAFVGQLGVGGLGLMCIALAAKCGDGLGLDGVEHGVEAVGLLVRRVTGGEAESERGERVSKKSVHEVPLG
ncbi:MAG: hypothetical protein ACI9U2_003919, partial [Bradymonadia bacterium]